MISLDAFQIGGKHKGYQIQKDAIHIFLNFKKIAEVKSKSEAIEILSKLIQDCPVEYQKDMANFKEILFRDYL